MQIKLKYMLPNVATCKKVRTALLNASIPEESIRFIAKPEKSLGGLNAASNLDSTNMIHEGEKGIVYGIILGLVSGIYVLTFPIWITASPAWYDDAPWYMVMGILIFLSAIIMAFGATLLGMNIFNTDLNRYKSEIDQGNILMIISVPLSQAHKMRKVIKSSLMEDKVKAILINQMKV